MTICCGMFKCYKCWVLGFSILEGIEHVTKVVQYPETRHESDNFVVPGTSHSYWMRILFFMSSSQKHFRAGSSAATSQWRHHLNVMWVCLWKWLTNWMFRAIDILKNLNSIGHNTTPVTGRPQCNRGFPDIPENVKQMSKCRFGRIPGKCPLQSKQNVKWGPGTAVIPKRQSSYCHPSVFGNTQPKGGMA